LEQSVWNVSKRQQQLSKGSFMQETMTTVKMIAAYVADSKGIETVLLWSNEYTGGDGIAQLKAILDIRKAFVHITYLDDDKI
jgi:hypothetical protein